MEKPEVYDYINYHLYLSDVFKALKSENPDITVRYIAEKAGYGSPGHVTWLFQGKRKLTIAKVPVFCELLGLNRKESRYFEAIVRYGNARTHESKIACFQRVAKLQKTAKRIVTEEEVSYWSRWYYSAVREIVEIHTVTDDNLKEVSSYMIPKISPSKMKEALNSLEKIGFIKKDEYGVYHRADTSVTTGDDWHSLVIREYQRNMMGLGQEALDSVDPENREISTLTLSISRGRAEFIKERIKEFRQELATLARTDDNPEIVYHMGLQFFPLSKGKGEGK